MSYENELVTLVNRSSKVCEGVWNGRTYQFDPARKYQFTRIQADKFKAQNPVMGSEDPRTGNILYLLAIEEDGDDLSPIEQTDAIEKWDRALLPEGVRKVDVVAGRNGIFSARDVQTGPITKGDTNFAKA